MSKTAPLRLAFRVEGDFWNAYCADVNSMKNSVLIGSIMMACVTDPKVKDAFMQCMKLAFEVSMRDLGSHVESWGDVEKAPEHERSGSA